MSNTFALFEYASMAFVVVVLFFNGLYFFVVLPRLTESRIEVGGDAFVGFRQMRYVSAYLGLLTEAERGRWYNVAIRHSFAVTMIAFFLCIALLAVSR